MQNFSLKFLDIMIGIVLGLGFQWWPELRESWQYVAFVFVYFDIIDYWIDYAPSLKKWPPKREIDVLLDVSIMFALFLYIYSTQLSFVYFLSSFILVKLLDELWLWSSKHEYKPVGDDRLFIETWLRLNLIEAVAAGVLIASYVVLSVSPLLLLIFIGFRLLVRIMASLRYKKIHFS